MINTKSLSACAAVALMLASAPAFAQSTQNSTGTTSGPAAGSNVVPGTATQKKAGNKPGVATGAPGVAAKKGSESGAKPNKHSPD